MSLSSREKLWIKSLFLKKWETRPGVMTPGRGAQISCQSELITCLITGYCLSNYLYHPGKRVAAGLDGVGSKFKKPSQVEITEQRLYLHLFALWELKTSTGQAEHLRPPKHSPTKPPGRDFFLLPGWELEFFPVCISGMNHFLLIWENLGFALNTGRFSLCILGAGRGGFVSNWAVSAFWVARQVLPEWSQLQSWENFGKIPIFGGQHLLLCTFCFTLNLPLLF